uniref:Aquaporin 1 (Colton blood group) n=1 Tax=Sparus aurata TaxID=8175 RepID=A0A671Y5G0_SPAAU
MSMCAAMSEMKTWEFWRAVLAECLGMIILVFIGLSAAIGDQNNSYPDHEIKVAFAFGLAVATLAQCIGHVSGAHLNPAITVGLLASCHMSLLGAIFYMIAQILGAVAGSAIVYGIRPETTHSLGVNKLNGITPNQGFGVEFLLTLQLVMCVLAVTDKRRDVGGFGPLAIGLSVGLGHLAGLNRVTKAQGFIIEFLATLQLVLCVIAVTDKRRSDVKGSAPLAIGLSVGLGHFAAISFTGCGINPARSFGPALIRSKMENHWVYWLGPMCGGIAAALIYDFLLCPRAQNFRTRRNVLLNGSEDEDAGFDAPREGNSSPGPSQGPSQWPKH